MLDRVSNLRLSAQLVLSLVVWGVAAQRAGGRAADESGSLESWLILLASQFLHNLLHPS